MYVYDDGLCLRTIWEVVENYAQEYFIFWNQSSLLFSNFPIRDDFTFLDAGNLPLCDTDFFAREPFFKGGQYSHILDFDMLRLGVKMQEDNPHVGGFEFGVILISEIDKERKNDLRLRELKLDMSSCNPKSDLMNEKFKMMGQDATVENYCFLRFLSDAQRPSSWGADARELSVVLHIQKHAEMLNALPLYWIEDGIISGLLSKWSSFWENARFKWGNDRLITYLINGIAARLYGYRLRRRNLYGFYRQPLVCESGTLEKEELTENVYFVACKKIFPKRFATDYFKFFSERQALRCGVGINDIPTYSDVYPRLSEISEQNSYFMKEIMNFYGKKE